MAKEFNLKILTPEHLFYDGPADFVMITAPDGKYSFMAGHLPLITVLAIGALQYRTKGHVQLVFNSEGFVEVSPDSVMIFTQTCERAEDIDINRAEEARKRAEEELRQQLSISEYKRSQIALARAMARLRVGRMRSSRS